jgi:type IV secretion system protein VirB10
MSEDNKQTNDAINSVRKVNQVGREAIKKITLNQVVVGAVALILIVMIFSGGSTQKVNKDQNNNLSATMNVSQELKENLAAIHHLEHANLTSNINPSSIGSNNDNSAAVESKGYAMRQNAPSTVYMAGGGASSSAPTQATLSGTDAYSKFGNMAARTTSVSAKRIAHPQSTIASGELMHAVLESAVNSDLPGQIRAVVSQPVYGYVGQTPIIPAGSRVIGQYSNMTMQGINRVMVVWNRIILPNGISVDINSPGVDQIGRAGHVANDVDTHFFARFGQAALLSLLSAGSSAYGGGGMNTAGGMNSMSMYQTAISQSLSQASQNSLQQTSSIKPTLRIYQGAKINIFVAHDLSFYNVSRPRI